jgi:hypothetical protein
MWLCDDLPKDLSAARIIIYGYDSQLHGSQSFQGLEDLATALRTMLKRIVPKTEVYNTAAIFPFEADFSPLEEKATVLYCS